MLVSDMSVMLSFLFLVFNFLVLTRYYAMLLYVFLPKANYNLHYKCSFFIFDIDMAPLGCNWSFLLNMITFSMLVSCLYFLHHSQDRKRLTVNNDGSF